MSYKKKFGHVTVKIVKVWPDFIDGVCVKTGRDVTFQMRYKMSEGLKKFLQMHIGTNKWVTVYCRPHTEEGMYWYSKISRGEHFAARGSIKKSIAYEKLMQEVEKDTNPVNTGSTKQRLVLGRGGLPTSANTSGKIGGALIRAVHRPDNPVLQRLAKSRKERLRQLREHRQREIRIEEKYLEWREINKKPEDEDKAWEKFLREYERKGTHEQNMIERYESAEETIEMLKEEEKMFAELKKVARSNYRGYS